MLQRSLADWLRWQESLNPSEIELGLDRVRQVAGRLNLQLPHGRIFTVAGTNGKGSCVAVLDALLRANGYKVGRYTSPHLVHYNERICVEGRDVGDETIVDAFEAIESVRGDVPLTFFEYGTLAAFSIFSAQNCDAWVLEVGLGGRLDAVNVIDPDVSIITTVDLDHEAWLGNTIEVIAFEKAGIMRAGRPAFYGDLPVPQSIQAQAQKLGSTLAWPGSGFACEVDNLTGTWNWIGRQIRLDHLPIPAGAAPEQIRNQALALAALEGSSADLLADVQSIRDCLGGLTIPGRFQIYHDDHEWVLDVAHNPQAARVLTARLEQMKVADTTCVVGMLADKKATAFAEVLNNQVDRWVCCDTDGSRGESGTSLARKLTAVLRSPPKSSATVEEALEYARAVTPSGGRIIVCGSFQVVGPALQWLGLY